MENYKSNTIKPAKKELFKISSKPSEPEITGVLVKCHWETSSFLPLSRRIHISILLEKRMFLSGIWTSYVCRDCERYYYFSQMPLRNVIVIDYLDKVREDDVSEWHLTVCLLAQEESDWSILNKNSASKLSKATVRIWIWQDYTTHWCRCRWHWTNFRKVSSKSFIFALQNVSIWFRLFWVMIHNLWFTYEIL